MTIGLGALAGLPPLAGFWSKDDDPARRGRAAPGGRPRAGLRGRSGRPSFAHRLVRDPAVAADVLRTPRSAPARHAARTAGGDALAGAAAGGAGARCSGSPGCRPAFAVALGAEDGLPPRRGGLAIPLGVACWRAWLLAWWVWRSRPGPTRPAWLGPLRPRVRRRVLRSTPSSTRSWSGRCRRWPARVRAGRRAGGGRRGRGHGRGASGLGGGAGRAAPGRAAPGGRPPCSAARCCSAWPSRLIVGGVRSDAAVAGRRAGGAGARRAGRVAGAAALDRAARLVGTSSPALALRRARGAARARGRLVRLHVRRDAARSGPWHAGRLTWVPAPRPALPPRRGRHLVPAGGADRAADAAVLRVHAVAGARGRGPRPARWPRCCW